MLRPLSAAMPPSCSVVVLVLSVVTPAVADTSAPDVLPTVVVTATRTAHTVDETLAPVTVLNQDDITQSSALTVPDLLRNVPGVDFSTSGGPGQPASMFLRGTNSDHVLLLVDGIPVASTTTGAPSWAYLPLTAVNRVEVVRGPGSSLYGSAAIGGIVQIFTPNGEGPAQPEASLRAGSYSTYQETAGVSGSTDGTHYSLGVGHLYTAGVDPLDSSVPHTPYDGGYRNSSVQTRLSQPFETGEFDVHVLRTEGVTGYDNWYGTPTNETFLQQVAGVDLTLSPRSFWKTRFTTGESRDDLAYDTSYINTSREYDAWQNDITLSPNQLLTAGIDHQEERVHSDTQYAVSARGDTGLFLQDQINIGRHDLIIGARHDANDAFGGHNTGNITYGLHLTSALRLTASWGSAFKAPTLNDLYALYPAYYGYSYLPNPNLRPETSHTSDVGVKGLAGWGTWELHAFRTDVNDLIGYQMIAPKTYLESNVNHARIEGIEANMTVHLADWELSSALEVLDPRNQDTDQILPRRARNTLQLGIAKPFGSIRTTLTILGQDGRYDDAANTVHLSGYTLVGMGVSYPLDRHWLLEGHVDNLLDVHYETAATYQSPGRVAMIGIRYTHR